MNHNLLSQQIQAGFNLAQNYVFPGVFVQDSLDELKKDRANPFFYYFKKDRRLKDFDDIQGYSKLLLLSEPGFGKSEFLRQYALHLAGKLNQDKIIPLYIELKGYRPSSYHALDEYIETQAKLRLGIDKPLSILKEEHALAFLLDGFDEVEKNDFSQIVDDIKLFLLNYQKHTIIISSRLHFYLRDPLLEDQNFTIAHITSFGNDEIQQYLQENGIEEQETVRLLEMFQEPDFSSILSIPRYLEKYLELYKLGITGRLSKAEIYNHFVNSRLEI